MSYHYFFGDQSQFGLITEHYYNGQVLTLLFEQKRGYEVFESRVIGYQKGSYIILFSCREKVKFWGYTYESNVWVLGRHQFLDPWTMDKIESTITNVTGINGRKLVAPWKGTCRLSKWNRSLPQKMGFYNKSGRRVKKIHTEKILAGSDAKNRSFDYHIRV